MFGFEHRQDWDTDLLRCIIYDNIIFLSLLLYTIHILFQFLFTCAIN